MNPKEELLELDLKRDRSESRFYAYFIGIVGAVIFFGVYVGNLLFGVNSLEVVIRLDAKERYLKESIQFLQEQNAKLQKEFFELKELEADVK